MRKTFLYTAMLAVTLNCIVNNVKADSYPYIQDIYAVGDYVFLNGIPEIKIVDGKILRLKYSEKYSRESERGLTVAYYNTNGNIIFYEFDGGSNCDDTKEHYFIHEGCIVDGAYHYVCGCCEDEDGTLLDIDTTRRVTDTPLKE